MYDLEMKIPEMPGEEMLNRMTLAVDPDRLGNHPTGMTADDIRNVYRRAFTPLCAAEKQACLVI